MIDVAQYMRDMVRLLREAFGERLLFVGLQGSHRRGEATPGSDLDVVVVLDRLGMEDLRTYRGIVDSLPEPDKACGFIGGAEELRSWPRHELFQFRNDTESHYGDLGGLMPEVTREDVADSVRFAASGLYHHVCHTLIHGDRETKAAGLRMMCKGAFSVLQAQWYLESGEYVGSKKELLERLGGDERDILAAGMPGAENPAEADADRLYALLLQWSGRLVRGA